MHLAKVYVIFRFQLYKLYSIPSCKGMVVVVKLLDDMLDITAQSELEAQAVRYTRINIC